MPKPSRTQKQIAERYKGNLGYYRKLQPWRRARFLVSLAVIFGGLLAILLFLFYGREVFFNAGPISTAHANFANNCAKCHDGAGTAGTFSETIRDRFRNGVRVE